jgi:hypothetical protein
VIQDGHFDDPYRLLDRWQPPTWVTRALRTFYTWQKFLAVARQSNASDLPLSLAVIRESAQYTRLRYPHSEFHVIFWNDVLLPLIKQDLEKAGISVHRVRSIVPDYDRNWTQYVLSEQDRHPNPLLHERIADYLVKNIFPAVR